MKVALKVLGGARAGMVIPITIPQFMIGRAEDCHLKPRSELISRYHCALLVESAYVAVRDLGSKNGVYVNGERIGVEQELKQGDRLAIGPLEFEILVQADAPVKTDPIADLVARVVAADSVPPVQAAPAPAPSAAPATPAAPASPAAASTPAAPATPAAETPAAAEATPVAEATPAAAQATPVAAPTAGAQDGPVSTDGNDLADWLLGDDEDVSEETTTIQAALDDLDLPYTPQEPKEEPQEEDKPEGPSSSDAAADMLRNFFRGGR